MRSKNQSNSFSDKSNKDSNHPSNPSNTLSHSQHNPAPQNSSMKFSVKKVPVFEAQAQREPHKT